MKKLGLLTIGAVFLASSTLVTADETDPATIEAWGKDCQKCHAEDGSGLTKKGRKLRLKDYRKADVQAEMTDEEMVDAITHGVKRDGEDVMNPYEEDYSPEQIEAFVAYIRTMAHE